MMHSAFLANQPAQAVATPVSSSSFYAAMRILPAVQREAMYEIYGFCRAVDDIADGTSPMAQRVEALNAWRRDIDACYLDTPPANLASLRRQIAVFGLAQPDFHAVLDGMMMDVTGEAYAPDRKTLELYCDRVAGAVGRLSVRVFGIKGEPGVALARELGQALQLTNILRDLDEDAAIDRLYLPTEVLSDAQIRDRKPQAVLSHPGLGQACAVVGAQAKEHFIVADRIMRLLPRAQVRAPRIMSAAYRSILDAVMARGFAPPRPRVRIARRQLFWILARYAIV